MKAKMRQWGTLPKEHLDQFNRNFAPHGLSLSAMEMLMIAMVWALVGVLLVNTQHQALPWLVPLGWLVMLLGVVGIVVSLLASTHEED